MRTVSNNLQVEKKKIIDFYDDYISGSLSVNRRYQRKLVWDLQEKQDFIDTLLRKYPIPLILLASYTFLDNNEKRVEVIDGLQRMEAIFSFISGKYKIKFNENTGYFNLDAIPGYGSKVRSGELFQNQPALPLSLCESFLKYDIPCSITETDNDNIDEIFRRINSKGRKLSNQDLRQAGIIGNFADIVRKTASYIRGDYSESDIIAVNKIEQYSLNNKNLEYGIDVNTTFWINQSIINEGQLRNSKDEEIIAHLYIYLFTQGKYSSSTNTLKNAYKIDHELKVLLDQKIDTEEKFFYWMELFSKTISIMNNLLNEKNFSITLFGKRKVYNKDYVFIIIFISIAQLLLDGMTLTNESELSKKLNNLGNTELQEVIDSADAPWNAIIRDKLVKRIINILKPYFSYKPKLDTESNEWDVRMVNLLERAEVEEQMYDFKAGITNFREGVFNQKCVSKIVETLTAMVNTRPNEEGIIILGVPNDDDATDEISNILKISPLRCKNYNIIGVKDEAKKYYGDVDSYIRKIKESIENEPISDSFKNEILTKCQLIDYHDKILLMFVCKSSIPVFYNKQLYVRFGSHNHEVEIGSDEFNLVQQRFYL